MQVAGIAKNEQLHHAYIVAGSAEGGREEVLALLEKRGVNTVGNPDLLSLSFKELLVDDVRDTLLSFAALKPVGERKYLVVSFARANDAAQNALLKAVEESLGHTVFFFSTDSAGSLLPTLRSRAVLLTTERRASAEDAAEAKEFFKESYEKRLARVEKMTAYISKTQDRTPTREFVRSLLSLAEEKRAPARVLRDLLDADRYLSLQGSSPKSVLGHLAVSLPRS
jgi:DNA polymerase III delta prime subunit